MSSDTKKAYVIGWYTKSRDKSGSGKNLMTREEAESLAAELNLDYPDFHHFALDTENPTASQAVMSTADAQEA